MKTAVLAVMFGVMFWGVIPATMIVQDPERTAQLQEAADLSSQVLELYREKKYDEALVLAQKALEIRQRLLAQNDPLISSALINIGELYLATRKYDDAEKVFQQAITIDESNPKERALSISRLLASLAYLKIRKHNFDKAEPLLLRSLSIQEGELGPTHPTTVNAMKDYACLAIRDQKEEEELFGKSDESTRSLKARAMCWLGGFHDNCAVNPNVKSEGVINGRAVKLIQPAYPVEARKKHLSGPAFVAILVDQNGDVVAAKSVCGGYQELNVASVQAARLSKFSPTRIHGEPVQVTGLIIYSFVSQ